jgi:iron complex outermembrane receptor protein
MKKLVGFAAISAAIYAPAALADENKDATLETVTVTSTKTQKIVSEAPASVSVVTDKQIENKNVERVDDALKNVTGVYIKANSDGTPSAWDNQILMRGMPGYYRSSVMVDGQTLNNGFSGGTNLSSIPIDNIEQIEVVPGPFSSLYGGSAMGGVVNIITKAPTKREIILRGGLGSNRTHSESGTYRDKWQFSQSSLGLSVNLDHAGSEGYVQDYVTKSASGGGGTSLTGWEATTSNTGSKTYIIGDKGKKGWVKDNAGLKLFFEPEATTKLTLESAYHNSSTSFDHSNLYLRNSEGTVYPTGTGANAVTLQGAGANISTRASDYLFGANGEESQRYKFTAETAVWNDASLKVNIGHMRNDYWYLSPATNAAETYGEGKFSDVPTNKTDLDVQLGKPIGSQHYLIVGGFYGMNDLDKHDYLMTNWRETNLVGRDVYVANGETGTKALYVQDEYTVTNWLTVYGGARLDRWATSGSVHQQSYALGGANYNQIHTVYDERTKSALSPKLSTVLKPMKGTTLRAAWGKAFRPPSLSDMYSTWNSSGGTTYWSNPDLKPEKSKSWEFGGEQNFAATGTTIKGTWFNTQIKDLIYSYTSGANNYKVSAGGAHINGVEGEIRQKVYGGVTAFANMTIQDSHITSNAIVPTSVGKRVTYMPDKMWNVGVDGEYEDWFGSLTLQHVEKVFTSNDSTDNVNGVYGSFDPYTLVNVKLGYRITPNYTASLALNNLTDEDYYQSAATMGRSFFFSIKAQY